MSDLHRYDVRFQIDIVSRLLFEVMVVHKEIAFIMPPVSKCGEKILGHKIRLSFVTLLFIETKVRL